MNEFVFSSCFMTSLWVYSCQLVFVFQGRQFLPPRPVILCTAHPPSHSRRRWVSVKSSIYISDPKTPLLSFTHISFLEKNGKKQNYPPKSKLNLDKWLKKKPANARSFWNLSIHCASPADSWQLPPRDALLTCGPLNGQFPWAQKSSTNHRQIVKQTLFSGE